MDNLFIFILSLALTFPILSPLPADLTVADHSATTVGMQEHMDFIGEEKENVSADQTVKSKKPDESISPDPLIASKPSLTVSLSSIEDPVQCKEMVETIGGVVYDTVSDALCSTIDIEVQCALSFDRRVATHRCFCRRITSQISR